MKTHFAVSLLFLSTASRPPTAQADVALGIETASKVQFNSQPGKIYQVYATTNLDRTGWSPLGLPQSGSGEEITFFHTTTGDQKLFFKVEENVGTPIIPASGIPLSLIQRARLNLQGQDLSGLTLTNLDLNNFTFAFANLKNADLSGSKFTDANLGSVNFTGAKLVGADLSKATGSSINFSGADLRNALVSQTDANFENANLSGATLMGPYMTSGNFHNTVARGLIGANIALSFSRTDGADFTGSDFTRAQISPFTSFVGANLTGVKFINTVFSAGPGQQITPVRFDNANLTDANLTGAKNFFDAPGIIYKNTKLPNGTIRTDP